MEHVKKTTHLTKFELTLWLSSCCAIILIFILNSHRDVLTLTASLIGVTALIYVAKGRPVGQILTVIFSIFYAVISYRFHYYGEMITYLGMTAPIAAMSVITWIKNPYRDGEKEVKVAAMSFAATFILFLTSSIVTLIFYYILKYFNTPNLVMSTISITTSFLASALMLFRSPYYAIAYACNDIVLIILWIMAATNDIRYLPMIICFIIFLVNDIYGFINWQSMKKMQSSGL